MAKEGDYAQVQAALGRGPQGATSSASATIGQVGNVDHENVSLGKAGRSRWLGKRPHVRGVAMNPVDHPHGRRRGQDLGRPPPGARPWGMPTKGYKTRNNKRDRPVHRQAAPK
ncbi:MAG: hypothetical protein MZV70_34325 [Desulfobacterales bacterium]|nr:hypothetical protein [Desulfobacterales bacterium]